MSNPEPIVVPVEDLNLKLVYCTPMRKNRGTGKPETHIVYGVDARPLILQFSDLVCGRGPERWNAAVRKYDVVDDKDIEWAHTAQYNKMKTGKVQFKIRLAGHKQENTAGWYAYRAMCGIIDRIVDCLAHGAPKIDAEGNVLSREPIYEKALPEDMARRILTTPLQDENNEYDPAIRSKVRYRLELNGKTVSVDQNMTAAEKEAVKLTLDGVIFDGSEGADASQRVTDVFKYLRGGSMGKKWLLQANPVNLKKAEANFTLEFLKAMIVPRVNKSESVGFVTPETKVEPTVAEESTVGGFGSGASAAAAAKGENECAQDVAGDEGSSSNPPPAKKVKV